MPFLPHEILMICILPALVLGSAFFSGTETALFSLTRHQRRQLTHEHDLVGAALRSLLAETRPLLLTLLLGNLTVNVLYFVITTVLTLEWKARLGLGAIAIAGFTAGTLFVIILLGEVLPKLVAANLAPAWSSLAALPLLAVHRALAPLRATVDVLIVTPLARLIAPPTRPTELSAVELAALLEMSEQRGLLEPSEENLLQQVLALRQIKVRDIMTPRVDIQAFHLGDSPERLYELIARTRRRRLVVNQGTLDNIVGVVDARQFLLKQPATAAELQPLIGRVHFVPELQRGDELLRHFRRTGATLAIAVDEYGGTAGLVTIEDVVEQMIGPIAGPYESPEAPGVQMIELGAWRVGAGLPIRDWLEGFGQVDSDISGVSTVGGLVMAKLGRLPKAGDRVKVGNLTIEVERMAGRRLASLFLRLETSVGSAVPGAVPGAPPGLAKEGGKP